MLSRNFLVRTRFFILTLLIIILWLVIGIVIYNYLNTYKKYQNISSELTSISYQAGNLESILAEFQYNDLHSSSFYESGKSDRTDQFDQQYLATYNHLRDLKNEKLISKNPLIFQKLNNLTDYLVSLDEKFTSLLSLSKEKGYGSYGIHGQLLSRASLMESMVELTSNQSIVKLFRQLRNQIYDYFETRSMISAQQLNEQFIQVSVAIHSGIPESFRANEDINKQIITGNLQTLGEELEKIISLDRQIGSSEFEGIRGDIRRICGIIKEESKALQALFQIDFHTAQKRIDLGLILLIIFSVSVFSLYTLLLARSIQIPLNQVSQFIHHLVTGSFPDPIQLNGNDEISEMARLLNKFTDNLKEKTMFASEIGKETEPSLSLLSKEDELGNALIQMGNHINVARIEDKKHKQESDKRRWINEGLAKFEEILRIYSSQLDVLADNLIQNLVKYLNATLGGLFLTDTENPDILVLAAAFAFDRKKYIKQSFNLGEGLVGTCAIEKQRIFLTDIPDEYISITSGLGDTKPKSLILIPLKFEDDILGVLEIASIQIFQDHEIEFVEKIGESIASAVSAVRMNMRTNQLLKQSQEQAREMAEQEEKMRQHVEELQATQEESARRESEISGILNAIHNSSLVAEYNMEEELTEINDKFLILLETHSEHIIGKKYHEIMGVNRHTDDYRKFWQQLREGKTISNVEKMKLVTGNEIWLRQTYTPILDKDGVPFKVLNIATDITETIKQQESLEKQASEITRKNIEMESFSDAVDEALIKCVYSPAGQIIEVNNNFVKATGYTEKEMIGKNNRIFLQRAEKDQFEKIWNDVVKDKPYSGAIRRTKPTGEEVWIMSTFTPVKDENGTIFKVYFLGQDITERKLKYQLLEEANKEIDRLRKLVE